MAVVTIRKELLLQAIAYELFDRDHDDLMEYFNDKGNLIDIIELLEGVLKDLEIEEVVKRMEEGRENDLAFSD
jgi:hypothetical protein